MKDSFEKIFDESIGGQGGFLKQRSIFMNSCFCSGLFFKIKKIMPTVVFAMMGAPGCSSGSSNSTETTDDISTDDTDSTSGSGAGWPSAACISMADDLVSKMTIEEKAAQVAMPSIGQTSAAEVGGLMLGAVFAGGGEKTPGGSTEPADWLETNVALQKAAIENSRLGIPVLIGIDAVHGHNGLTGTTIFPHNIGLGCSRNPELVKQAAEITAKEMVATGFNWTFAPMVSTPWDDRWGRTYETYSEDPELVETLGAAAVTGLQGEGGLSHGLGVIACAKHFAGDGQTTFGISHKGGTLDRGDAQIDLATMMTYGINPYRKAIEAGLGSIMVSDAYWNDSYMTSHAELLSILKDDLSFAGFVSTDWEASMPSDSMAQGVDIYMQPAWSAAVIADAETLSEDVLDGAVHRILVTKCEAGLFDWSEDSARELLDEVGSAAHRSVARQAVRESLVLLQNNDGVLPLSKTANVFVTGSGADDIGKQCGGWTISWQGSEGETTQGTTVKDAIGKVAPLVDSADQADVVVVVLAESPYAEMMGDISDITDAYDEAIPPEDLDALVDAGDTPTVAIIMSGRPVYISQVLDNADAWVAAWLPGTEGDGIADVLFGDYDFTGKLAHSWPRNNDDVRINYYDDDYEPLFAYGHGLSYEP